MGEMEGWISLLSNVNPFSSNRSGICMLLVSSLPSLLPPPLHSFPFPSSLLPFPPPPPPSPPFSSLLPHSDWYEGDAVMMCEEGSVIAGLLMGLNAIDYNVMMKGEDFDKSVSYPGN